MNHLDRLERFAQRLIEGLFNRVFQSEQKQKSRSGKIRVKTKDNLPVARHRANQWALQLDDRQQPLGGPVIRIGRALDNDITLTDHNVSRYHAELRWRNGGYHLHPPAFIDETVHQENSVSQDTVRLKPHTTVNNVAATRRLLKPGDIITLGKTTLTVIVKSPNQ